MFPGDVKFMNYSLGKGSREKRKGREASPAERKRLVAPVTCFISMTIMVICLSAGIGRAAESATVTNNFSQPLSLADALNVALRQNPNILRAQKDLEAAQGVIIQTKAIAIPKVRISGAYSAIEPTDVDSPPASIPSFTFGTDQSWSSQIRLVQSLYEGGRMVSAFRAARLIQEQSVLNYKTVEADTILEVEIAYFDVLLASQQIVVQEASVDLLNHELIDTTRRHEAGTVPRFNVLR